MTRPQKTKPKVKKGVEFEIETEAELVPVKPNKPKRNEVKPLVPRTYKPKGATLDEFIMLSLIAFEDIGGISRYSLWADQNPTEFYRSLVKLLTASVNASKPQLAELNINLSGGLGLPTSPLDDITLRNEDEVNRRYTDIDQE